MRARGIKPFSPRRQLPLDARGNADFKGKFATIPGTCGNPLFLIRIGPDLPGANQRWIATGAVRIGGQ